MLTVLLRVILIVAVPFLVSCAATERRPPNKANYKLDASSSVGGVIFGWRIANPSANAIFYNVVWTCYDRATGIVCPARDPNSEKNAFGVPQRLNLWGVTRRPGFASPGSLSTMTYHVLLMPPGEYVLSYLTESLPQPYLPPTFRITLDNDSVSRFAEPGGTISSSTAPRFTVRSGTMIYAGDLTFDMKGAHVEPRIERNEAAARAALAEYPNIAAELRALASPN